jgi:hypothetical protein
MTSWREVGRRRSWTWACLLDPCEQVLLILQRRPCTKGWPTSHHQVMSMSRASIPRKQVGHCNHDGCKLQKQLKAAHSSVLVNCHELAQLFVEEMLLARSSSLAALWRTSCQPALSLLAAISADASYLPMRSVPVVISPTLLRGSHGSRVARLGQVSRRAPAPCGAIAEVIASCACVPGRRKAPDIIGTLPCLLLLPALFWPPWRLPVWAFMCWCVRVCMCPPPARVVLRCAVPHVSMLSTYGANIWCQHGVNIGVTWCQHRCHMVST